MTIVGNDSDFAAALEAGADVVLGRVVAVKVLKQAMLRDPEFSARFYGEARMMAAFRHPGVVEVYDYAGGGDGRDEDDVAYLVMAYVEGEPLSARLKEAGHLSVTETMSIVAQTAEALHAAHRHGTVHRDVKPGNLIVKPNGTVILVDFGVARSAQVTSLTGLNAIVGTALYMAPEQVAKGDVTPATDIYALGAVAYHCITGGPPFDGDNALQVALRHLEDEPEPLPPDVPEPVRELVTRAMAKHPADRCRRDGRGRARRHPPAGLAGDDRHGQPDRHRADRDPAGDPDNHADAPGGTRSGAGRPGPLRHAAQPDDGHRGDRAAVPHRRGPRPGHLAGRRQDRLDRWHRFGPGPARHRRQETV